MALALLLALKHGLLFSYGTSKEVADDHHPQSRSVAYTIGGLLVFVTLPFLFCGTVYLLHDEFASITMPAVRWTAVLLAAALITAAVLWVERALLVLSDAIWPHFTAQLAMFLIRVGMVFLFSVVIAQKWVLNSYAGPIQKELVAMANEAQELERKNATSTFNVDALEKRMTTAQDRTHELELKLASLPSSIVSDTERLNVCKVESTRLNAERSEMRRIPDRTEMQNERLRELEVSARVKMTDCNLKEKSINTAVRAYREPIETELAGVRTTASEVATAHATAEKSAAEQATERSNKSAQALNMNGADQEAFARVRAKNTDIDLEVRKKTLLLAALELLPLLLKLLTYNSPIAMQARALLQQESAGFRAHLHQSIEKEKTSKSGAPKTAPPSPAGWGYTTASPCVAPTNRCLQSKFHSTTQLEYTMSHLTQAIQSIFSGHQAAGTPASSGPFASGQDPFVGGLDNVTRLKTYNEQPVHLVMDDSISMSGDPSREASLAAMALAKELADSKNKDGFRLNVFRFGSSATMVASAVAPQTLSVAFSGTSGGTVAAPAMKMAQSAEKAFTPRPERRLVTGIVVFMSDGALSDPAETIRVANEMKQAGMTIITIGFGSGADVATLQAIASSPQHYAYANLGSLVGLFAKVGKTLSQQLSKAA